MRLAPGSEAVRDAVAALAARAAPFGDESVPRPSHGAGAQAAGEAALTAERLQRWCDVAAGGSWDAFDRRLAWSGWTRDDARVLLRDAPVSDAAEDSHPAWVDALTDAIVFARAPEAFAERSLLVPGDPVAFEELLVPFVAWARAEVARRAPLRSFGDDARAALERALLRRLSETFAPALFEELAHRRPAGHALMAAFLGGATPTAPRSRERYLEFAGELSADALLSFFARYPVLARLCGEILIAWCDATAELGARLEADLPLLRARFGAGGDLGQVVAVKPALSDPHHGGRSVAVLTFAAGAHVVYKPRGLAADAAFGEFLAWCDGRLRAPETIDRGAYGWSEFIAHAPCADGAAVERFYERAGKLLCVLYLCGTTDCHFENLVAHGEEPVLIDAETVLQPQLAQADAAPSEPHAEARSWDTVVRTGFLPRWDFSADDRLALDTSALGAFASLQGHQPRPAWRDVNTDAMSLGSEPWAPAAPHSVPLLDGEPAPPGDHLDAFVRGFERMHRAIAERRDELLAAAERRTPPLAAFAHVRVRFVPRATNDYGVALHDGLRPAALRSGIDHSIALDVLSRAFANAAERPGVWEIQRAERRALERADVPHFTIATTGAQLDPGDGAPVPVPVLAPGFADLVARLQRWDARDLRWQLAIVRGAFHARTARGVDTAAAMRPLPGAAESGSARTRAAEFVAAARALGDELEATGIPDAGGGMSWVGLMHHAGTDRFVLEPLGVDLYGGTAGIAVFYAALARTTGEARYGRLAHAAVDGVRRRLRDATAARALVARIGIGGANGMGSIVYALTRAGVALDDAELLADARRAALLIDDDAIARDTYFDAIAGSAGAIFGLLELHRRAPDTEVLARAVAAGEHLLRSRTGAPGTRAWLTFAKKPLTGFAHGAAGIALALERLHAACGDARFLAAADEAIAYERSVYAPAFGNWPDYRAIVAHGDEPGHSTMWCHGAPGIGLARLGSPRAHAEPEMRAEIDAAIGATVAFGVRGPDYLCCGNLGRADVLLEAGVRLQRPELRLRAEALAAALLGDARDDGFRLVYDMRAPGFKPDLFRGAAGVGYELLRLADPEGVPSVLSWS